MYKVESLNNYIKTKDVDEVAHILKKITKIMEYLKYEYSNYQDWFLIQQLSDVGTSKREILFVRNPKNKNELLGLASLKKDEKKICSIYVLPNYRKKGIGTKILEESMNWLETTKPFISFSDEKLDLFLHFIVKYDWQLREIIHGVYNNKEYEMCFNGIYERKPKEKLTKQILKKYDYN